MGVSRNAYVTTVLIVIHALRKLKHDPTSRNDDPYTCLSYFIVSTCRDRPGARALGRVVVRVRDRVGVPVSPAARAAGGGGSGEFGRARAFYTSLAVCTAFSRE